MDITRQKYRQHKSSAKARGIEFSLSFEEWKSIWGQHIAQRGRGADQLGMLRTRDQGGYEVGNVRLGTPKENRQESLDVRVGPIGNCRWLSKRKYVFDEYVEDEED